MNRRFFSAARAGIFSALLVCVLAVNFSVLAQDPVPTLVPPTLVPPNQVQMIDALPSESAVARIQRDSKVRIGILFNEPPFGELNIRGDITGFDADLARSMAETWGVEVELIQVTRQTAIDLLRTGVVDILIAAQVHRRDLDAMVEFSQTYYPGQQMMLVREGDGATVLGHMENRKVGVVIGTRGERAVAEWLARTGLPVTVQQYLTLDQAIAGLIANEVDGVVENRVRLTRTLTQPDLARFVDEPVDSEPYAVAVRRQDVNMRNLVNKTLQFLLNSGKLNDIHKAHFEGAAYPRDGVVVWANLGEEAPNPSQFGTDIPSAQYIVPRLQSDGVLRVAGLGDPLPEDAPESQRRLESINRAVIEAMASRWGVRAEFVPANGANPLDLVATGQADIAVGVQGDWGWADRVDFTNPYLLHGRRLLVPADDEVAGFTDLRGDWIGVYADDPEARDQALSIAESLRVRLENTYTINNEAGTFEALFEQNNIDAVFGDSLKLVPLAQQNPDLVKIVTNETNGGWYSRNYLVLGVPRNDIDFRLLVEYTLQEMARGGMLDTLLQPVLLPEDMLNFEIWPGPQQYLGYSLAG